MHIVIWSYSAFGLTVTTTVPALATVSVTVCAVSAMPTKLLTVAGSVSGCAHGRDHVAEISRCTGPMQSK